MWTSNAPFIFLTEYAIIIASATVLFSQLISAYVHSHWQTFPNLNKIGIQLLANFPRMGKYVLKGI